MGGISAPVDSSGRPEIEFVPDQGDELSFTVRRSSLGWPTPFEFNIMIRRSPSWKPPLLGHRLRSEHRESLARLAQPPDVLAARAAPGV